MKRLLQSLLLLACLLTHTFAHPVAQGSIICDVSAGGVTLEARITNEEIFLVAANIRDTPPDSVDAARTMHGGYLLEKLHVFADERALTGAVTEMAAEADHSAVGFTRYTLHFALPAGASQQTCRQICRPRPTPCLPCDCRPRHRGCHG